MTTKTKNTRTLGFSEASLRKMRKLYISSKNYYYNSKGKPPKNGEVVISDAEFDKLEDTLRKVDPSWAELRKTGASVMDKKTEVELKEFMPSLNKAYPEAISKWVSKNSSDAYIVTDKLDGASIQLVYKNGRLAQIVTRGDGTLGGDITFLAEYLSVPNVIKSKSLTIFRCEAICKKDVFAKKWSKEFDTARNMVSGLLNRRKPHPAMASIDFVVLGCYGLSQIAGLNLARLEGLQTVSQTKIPSRVATPEGFSSLLKTRLAKSAYEMDGLVVVPSNFVFAYKNADKPKNAVAFKVNHSDDEVPAVVTSVIWQVSRHGRIIPKIEIEPIKLGGVTVTYCTAHNAEWMQTRGIGKGAKVVLVRSGGVIPKIVGVTKKAKTVATPDIAYEVQGKHFVALGGDATVDRGIELERLNNFIVSLGVEFAGKKTLALVQNKLPTPSAWISAWAKGRLPKTLVGSGVGSAMSAKIVDSFDKAMRAADLAVFIKASQAFDVGFGERMIAKLVDNGIDLRMFNSTKHHALLLQKILEVPGFSDKKLKVVADGLSAWVRFYKELQQCLDDAGIKIAKPKQKPKLLDGVLKQLRVSFTGYRSADEEKRITEAGGVVVPFGSKTQVLLVKAGGKASSKVDKARDKGIRVAEFKDLKI